MGRMHGDSNLMGRLLLRGKKILWQYLKVGGSLACGFLVLWLPVHVSVFSTRLCVFSVSHSPPFPGRLYFPKMAAKPCPIHLFFYSVTLPFPHGGERVMWPPPGCLKTLFSWDTPSWNPHVGAPVDGASCVSLQVIPGVWHMCKEALREKDRMEAKRVNPQCLLHVKERTS